MPLLGSETPRLSTRPLRPPTSATSLGFEVIEFATRFCHLDLMPWQRWWLIAALELLPDGNLRYRTILTLVGRQNGKTELLKVLALWSMYSGRAELVLGVAQNLSIAREAWQGTIDYAEADLALWSQREYVHRGAGDHEFKLRSGPRYKIGAANGKAGRGLTVDLLILDELREHRSEDAWAALSATTTARRNALIVAITNAGDEQSVVLNHLRDAALAGADESLGLFEWSAEDDCDLDDRDGWAQANPGLGHTIDERILESAMATMSPGRFRTEHLCQRVDAIDAAIDLAAWRSCADAMGTLDTARDRLAMCLDVAPDLRHVTLYAAATLGDGRVRIAPVRAWTSTDAARLDLPGLIERNTPRVLGWFPGGPAAALAADLRGLAKAFQLKASDVPPVCQGFAEHIVARRILHSDDPLLNAHIAMTTKRASGDGWRFARKDVGHCDAVYAAAGAVHLARTLAPSVGRPRIVVAA